jgi:hypothetical protein
MRTVVDQIQLNESTCNCMYQKRRNHHVLLSDETGPFHGEGYTKVDPFECKVIIKTVVLLK